MNKKEILNKIEKEINKHNLDDRYEFESCSENIDDFLYELIVTNKNNNEMYEFIAENLDYLMKYSTGNSRWFREILDNEKLRDKFIIYIKNNLSKFKNDIDFIEVVALLNKYECYDVLTSKEFLNKLFDLKFPNDFYLDLYIFLPEEFIPTYIDLCIENRLTFSNTFLYLIFTFYKEYFISNFDRIINSTKEIISLKTIVVTDSDVYKKLVEYIDKNEELVLNKISEAYIERKMTGDIGDISLLKNILVLIIKDIIKNENVKVSDITEVGTGAFSTSLRIGDKIIKIGKRNNKKIKNNPYILTPLLRREFKVDNNSIFVEVVERVNTDEKYSFDEIYSLYKKLRDIGLVWTDCTNSNVGRLIKDNKRYWRFDLQPSDKLLNLEPGNLNTRLKEGELVILDSDYIFDENDPNIIDPHTTNLLQFETRYKKELEEKNNGMHI